MPMTITNVHRLPWIVAGGTYQVLATAQFDSSYAAGGESLSKIELGLPSFSTLVEVKLDPASGLSFEYDYTNSKVKVLSPVKIYTATHDPASIAAVSSVDNDITVTGVATTDKIVAVWMPAAALASVAVQAARVQAVNTVRVRLTNPSAAAVDLASGTFDVYTVAGNGAAQEVANATDLSAVTTRLLAVAQ